MLDNVIDLSAFPVEKVHVTAAANRRIGLGVMGFADMLYQLNVGYGAAMLMLTTTTGSCSCRDG